MEKNDIPKVVFNYKPKLVVSESHENSVETIGKNMGTIVRTVIFAINSFCSSMLGLLIISILLVPVVSILFLSFFTPDGPSLWNFPSELVIFIKSAIHTIHHTGLDVWAAFVLFQVLIWVLVAWSLSREAYKDDKKMQRELFKAIAFVGTAISTYNMAKKLSKKEEK